MSVQKETMIKVLRNHSEDTGLKELIYAVKHNKDHRGIPDPKFLLRDQNKKLITVSAYFSQDSKEIQIYQADYNSKIYLFSLDTEEVFPSKSTTTTTTPKVKATTTTTTTKKVTRRKRTTTTNKTTKK